MSDLPIKLSNAEYKFNEGSVPEGYFGMSANVEITNDFLSEIRYRIKRTEKYKDVSATACVYPPQVNEGPSYIELTVSCKNDNETKLFHVPLLKDEEKSIRDQIISGANCKSFEEFAEKTYDIKHDFLKDLFPEPNEIDVTEKSGELRFEFSPNERAKAFILVYSDFLEKNTYYFDEGFKSVALWEQNRLDELLFFCNFYPNGKCNVEIDLQDKETGETSSYPMLMSLDSKQTEVFKSALNTYFALTGQDVEIDEILETYRKKENKEKDDCKSL